jgi:UDP-3-O-[3-hydroxymyristoyl] glucosamine N-acyltransferase
MPRYTLSQIQAVLGGSLHENDDRVLIDVASLGNAGREHLSFIVSEKHLKAAAETQAGALIAPMQLAGRIDRPTLAVANPHVVFARAAALFHPEPALRAGVHSSAAIDPTATIDPETEIGPNAVIGARSRIGRGCRIGAGCVIGEDVVLGQDCRLYPNVTLYHDCRLGDRVVLHAGCVVGSDGFGLAWDAERWLKVPQIGRVVIGDDVDIGANTTIDRGALDDTVIMNGAKIDNLVQIAHNCAVGEHTAIAGCAGIAGSTRIGSRCLIGGAAMILGHIEIGDGVTVSGASFVGKSIKTPGVYTSTQPQMPHDEWLKNAAQLRHLAEMRDRIRILEKKLSDKER